LDSWSERWRGSEQWRPCWRRPWAAWWGCYGVGTPGGTPMAERVRKCSGTKRWPVTTKKSKYRVVVVMTNFGNLLNLFY
jgi:hypothetical protein